MLSCTGYALVFLFVDTEGAFIVNRECGELSVDYGFLVLGEGDFETGFVGAYDGDSNVTLSSVLVDESEDVFLAVVVAYTADFHGALACNGLVNPSGVD